MGALSPSHAGWTSQAKQPALPDPPRAAPAPAPHLTHGQQRVQAPSEGGSRVKQAWGTAALWGQQANIPRPRPLPSRHLSPGRTQCQASRVRGVARSVDLPLGSQGRARTWCLTCETRVNIPAALGHRLITWGEDRVNALVLAVTQQVPISDSARRPLPGLSLEPWCFLRLFSCRIPAPLPAASRFSVDTRSIRQSGAAGSLLSPLLMPPTWGDLLSLVKGRESPREALQWGASASLPCRCRPGQSPPLGRKPSPHPARTLTPLSVPVPIPPHSQGLQVPLLGSSYLSEGFIFRACRFSPWIPTFLQDCTLSFPPGWP